MILKDKKPTPWVYHKRDGLLHQTQVTKLKFEAADTVRELREALTYVDDNATIYTTETGLTITVKLKRVETLEEEVARVNAEAEVARADAALWLAREAAKVPIKQMFARSKNARLDAVVEEIAAIEKAAHMVMSEMVGCSDLSKLADLMEDAKTLNARMLELQAEFGNCNKGGKSS